MRNACSEKPRKAFEGPFRNCDFETISAGGKLIWTASGSRKKGKSRHFRFINDVTLNISIAQIARISSDVSRTIREKVVPFSTLFLHFAKNRDDVIIFDKAAFSSLTPEIAWGKSRVQSALSLHSREKD